MNNDLGNTIFDPEITANTFNQFFFISMYEQHQSTSSNEYDTTTIDHNIESKNPHNIEFNISRVTTAYFEFLTIYN